MTAVRSVRPVLLLLAVLGCVKPAEVAPPPRAPSPSSWDSVPTGATVGAVASAESDATRVGLGILRAGGNAADAAVAVALALAVVHPQAGNLGGGGFAIVKWGDEISTLDFRETAPAAARQDMFLAADGTPIPRASLVGPLASGVPGSPSGLFELHRRYGRLPWPDVVTPAIRLARDGFEVSARLEEAIDRERHDLARYPETAAVWLPGGETRPVGATMTLPELARTLSAYALEGPAAITSGRVAAAVERASRAHGGVLTAEDLAAYRPVWRKPVRFRAFGWNVASMPLPSSGGIIIGQTFLMLEKLDWPGLSRRSADRDHLLVEAWRRAYADRYLLGDPLATRADVGDLLDPRWIARRAAGISRSKATPSHELRPWSRASAEGSETTHLSVADGAGNLVALTTTLNGWFGCYLYVRGAGFLLNNEMDDFTTAPGGANLFGLVQGEANVVRAGARMLSSMAPTIAWREGDSLALGSPGGSRIPTAVAQVLLNVMVDNDTLQVAVQRPRIHHQWLPDEIDAESGALGPDLSAELEGRGHRIVEITHVGEVEAVRYRDGMAEAAGDGRGPGSAGALEPLMPATGRAVPAAPGG